MTFEDSPCQLASGDTAASWIANAGWDTPLRNAIAKITTNLIAQFSLRSVGCLLDWFRFKTITEFLNQIREAKFANLIRFPSSQVYHTQHIHCSLLSDSIKHLGCDPRINHVGTRQLKWFLQDFWVILLPTGFKTSLVPIRLDRLPSHTASLVTCLTAPNLQFSFERDTIGNAGHFFKHHAKRFLHRQPHDLSFWNNHEIRRN